MVVACSSETNQSTFVIRSSIWTARRRLTPVPSDGGATNRRHRGFGPDFQGVSRNRRERPAWIPVMILSGLRRVFRAPPYTVLRPDDHLPNTVAILAGYCEGLIDVFYLSGVCKQRSKPLGVRVE
jgi:hypothetical protein